MGNRKERNDPAPSRSRPARRTGGDLPRGASRETTVPAEALVSPRHEQHTRKGQAQSPRELTHNEPPKRKRKGGL
jgi:hypothetical protein